MMLSKTNILKFYFLTNWLKILAINYYKNVHKNEKNDLSKTMIIWVTKFDKKRIIDFVMDISCVFCQTLIILLNAL